MQPHVHAHDRAQRPEGAREQLGEVIPGDVLDDLAASPRDRPVCERDRDADDEVTGPAVAVTERTGVGGCKDAADGGSAIGAQRWVEGEHLALGGKPGLRHRQRHAGLHRRRQVADVVLCDAVKRACLQDDAWIGHHVSPTLFGTSAEDAHRLGLARRVRQNRGRGLRRIGLHDLGHLQPRRHSGSLQGMLAVGPGDLAAQPRGGHHLAGVCEPVRVKRASQPVEALEVALREHGRHLALLVDADAVLAGDRAAKVEARAEDQIGQLLGALGFSGRGRVVADQGVKVSVAGVEDVGDLKSMLCCQLFDAAQRLRAAASGG